MHFIGGLVNVGRRLVGSALEADSRLQSLGRQAMRTPRSLLAARAKAVISGRPVIWDFQAAVEEMLAGWRQGRGVLQVGTLDHASAREALKQQGIETIVMAGRHWFVSHVTAQTILKRATAGMAEGQEYTYRSDPLADFPDVIKMVRTGPRVEVTYLNG